MYNETVTDRKHQPFWNVYIFLDSIIIFLSKILIHLNTSAKLYNYKDFFLDNLILLFLLQPGRDKTGAAIALFRARYHNPEESSHQATLQGLISQLDAALERSALSFMSEPSIEGHPML